MSATVLGWTLLSVALLGAALLTIAAGIRSDRIDRMDDLIDAVNQDIDATRWCAAHGHAYRVVPAVTVWRCRQCGDVVESKPGWAGDQL